ncbi:MAG: hypothetical protein WBL15_12460 [Phycisphaerae bacterium]|jgi:hypothetical protein
MCRPLPESALRGSRWRAGASAARKAYGTLIPALRIECRALFVVDKDGTIRHAEYVPEVGEHPNYDAALAALKTLNTTAQGRGGWAPYRPFYGQNGRYGARPLQKMAYFALQG